MSALSEEVKGLLTPEERAAIEDTMSPDEVASLKAVADAADDDEDEEDDKPAADAAPVESPAASAGAEAPPVAATTAPADVVADAPAPDLAKASASYTAALPADFDERVAALETKEAAAYTRFEDGELDAKGLQAELRALSREQAEIDKLRTKAEIASEMTQQSAEAQWLAAVDSFKREALKEGINYDKDEARAGDLDLFVKTLAQNPAHGDKSMQWFLTEAHKRVKALHGGATPAAAAAPVTPVDPKKAAVAARKADPSAAPVTLAQVPGSDGPGDVGSEFADMDRLEGLALEDAIKRMTPDQRERYAKGL